MNDEFTDGQKFARKCSVTGEGMSQGFLVGDCNTIKNEADLIALIRDCNGTDDDELSDDYVLAESYALGEYIYTEWEDEDEFQYQVINGVLTEIQ